LKSTYVNRNPSHNVYWFPAGRHHRPCTLNLTKGGLTTKRRASGRASRPSLDPGRDDPRRKAVQTGTLKQAQPVRADPAEPAGKWARPQPAEPGPDHAGTARPPVADFRQGGLQPWPAGKLIGQDGKQASMTIVLAEQLHRLGGRRPPRRAGELGRGRASRSPWTSRPVTRSTPNAIPGRHLRRRRFGGLRRHPASPYHRLQQRSEQQVYAGAGQKRRRRNKLRAVTRTRRSTRTWPALASATGQSGGSSRPRTKLEAGGDGTASRASLCCCTTAAAGACFSTCALSPAWPTLPATPTPCRPNYNYSLAHGSRDAPVLRPEAPATQVFIGKRRKQGREQGGRECAVRYVAAQDGAVRHHAVGRPSTLNFLLPRLMPGSPGRRGRSASSAFGRAWPDHQRGTAGRGDPASASHNARPDQSSTGGLPGGNIATLAVWARSYSFSRPRTVARTIGTRAGPWTLILGRGDTRSVRVSPVGTLLGVLRRLAPRQAGPTRLVHARLEPFFRCAFPPFWLGLLLLLPCSRSSSGGSRSRAATATAPHRNWSFSLRGGTRSAQRCCRAVDAGRHHAVRLGARHAQQHDSTHSR